MNDNDQNLLVPSGEKKPAIIERYAGDVNISRHAVFASKNVRGYRVLPLIEHEEDGVKVVRQVAVGTYKDTGKSLDEDDEVVYWAIYGRWQKKGCHMDDRKLTTALMNTTRPMLPGPDSDKQRRLTVRDYKKLRLSLDKLARVPIEFDNAYENNRGYSTETILLLEKVELFNRKEKWGDHGERGGKYFEFTTLELNRKVCQNIKDGKIKLIYLDQFAAIKGETGRLIYKRLEFLGGVIKLPFRREALEFAKECTINLGPNGIILQPKEIIRKMRRACKEITGKLLTCGVIGKCSVGREGDRWFFVCHINKVVTVRQKKTKHQKVTMPIVPDRRDVEHASERARDQRLFERYDKLPADQRVKIDERTKEIIETKYHGYAGRFPRLEAIREYFGIETLHQEIGSMKKVPALSARSTDSIIYMGEAQRSTIKKLAEVLKRLSDVKTAGAI